MSPDFAKQLKAAAGAQNVSEQEPMRLHTTFRIGGPADYFVSVTDAGLLRDTVRLCREEGVPFAVIGNGSNLLVGDKGYRGVILQIFRGMNRISIDDVRLTAQAGALMSAVSREAQRNGLGGLAFASGIPGTLGGGLVMNAGAYDGELKDCTESVTVLTPEDEIRTYTCEEMAFGYRTSLIQKAGGIILEAVLRLQREDPEKILARMEELREKRTAKQPLELPSAGSTFKRPEGNFAGKLIMEAGLRGFRVGDAQVSEKHCGFVVNRGSATAAQVRELMEKVQEEVLRHSGVRLEPEVRFLGEF